MSAESFIELLRQQTEEDKQKLVELKKLFETTRTQLKFLEKRITSSESMINTNG